MREVTNQISDESVRRHYAQDMRERIAAFFGTSTTDNRGRNNNNNSSYGASKFGKPYGGGKSRIAMTRSLTNSRLTKNTADSVGDIPVREAALMSAVICHPDLLSEAFDAFFALEFENKSVANLKGAYYLEQVDKAISRARLWVFTEEAAFDDALSGFNQALQLYQRAKGLSNELRAAEEALVKDGSEANWARFQDIQLQVRKTQGLDALVEGFGTSSGRPSRNF
ncbi:hypothetical protein GQR58_029452 [Nymphon striatum]|nr:hypothetical protein GQR58_029452 [Nymphon striatum]